MKLLLRRRLIVLLACFALLLPTKPAKADELSRDVYLGIAGAAVAIVVIVAVAYHFIHKPAIHGCVSSGPNGLQLTDGYAQQVYTLSGNIAGITAGDQVKLKGHKRKHSLFEVDELAKDYGVCKAQPPTP